MLLYTEKWGDLVLYGLKKYLTRISKELTLSPTKRQGLSDRVHEEAKRGLIPQTQLTNNKRALRQ